MQSNVRSIDAAPIMSPFEPKTVADAEHTQVAVRTSPDESPRANRRVPRSAIELAVGLGIGFLVLRTWCIAWFVVASGSMAPALLGPHAHAECPDCGFHFDCGIEGPESLGRPTVCPNCGAMGDPIDEHAQLGGARLPVHQAAFALRLPRRWEIAAFRRPEKASDVCVKRVVGLPGETIEIREGDVFADGRIQRKSLAEQRALAVLVYDNNFRPQPSATLPPRWRAEQGGSPWQADGGGFTHPQESAPITDEGWHALSAAKGVARGETMPVEPQGVSPPKAVATSKPIDPSAIDWLAYHHQRRVPGDPAAAEETPIVDLCGYNQTRPVLTRYAIHDVLLSCRVKVSGRGVVAFRACDGDDVFIAWLDSSRQLVQLDRKGRQVRTRPCDLSPLAAGALVEVSLVDRRFLLALDGQPLLALPYDRPTGDWRPTTRPLAIGSLGSGIEVRDLRVQRDVYYVPVGAAGDPAGRGASLRLAADEFYVLGDNSPLSQDSRGQRSDAAVPAKLLLGKPLMIRQH
jgi:signal peptidase I